MTEIAFANQSDAAETLLIPLYLRAIETQRSDALIRDDKAVALVKQMNYDFSRIKLSALDQVACVLRLREFDRYARDFLARYPEAVVVHIGCGLHTRFERVDNGQLEWYDLDLPEVIELRRKLIGGSMSKIIAEIFQLKSTRTFIILHSKAVRSQAHYPRLAHSTIRRTCARCVTAVNL